MTNAPQLLWIDRRTGIQIGLYPPDECINEVYFTLSPDFDGRELHGLTIYVTKFPLLSRLISDVDRLYRSDNSKLIERLQNARIRIRQAAMKRRPRLRRPG